MEEHRVRGERQSREGVPTDSSGRADLHTHTTHSDGVLTPQELIHKAKATGLSALAITDHDNVAAIDEAIEWGKSVGITVIPGVELSITFGQKDIHLLAYFIDHHNQKLLDYLTFFRHERLKRAERMVAKLNKINVPLRFESVLEQAGVGSIGRPHIAYALVEEGLAESYHEAFEKYIGMNGPAYEKKFQLSPPEAFHLVTSVGGLSFFAHPGRYTNEAEIIELIKMGLDGIEVIHPSHSESQTQYYREIAHQYFMLESGGSDFHGGRGNEDSIFGTYAIPMEFVEAMRKRLFA